MQFRTGCEGAIFMRRPKYMLDTDMFSYLVSNRHPEV